MSATEQLNVIIDPDWDNDEAMAAYLDYLQEHLELPCEVTDVDDFRWEEKYSVGRASMKKSPRLDQTRHTYLEHYELLGLELQSRTPWVSNSQQEIIAQLRRVSDDTELLLPLCDLKAVMLKSPNHRLIADYAAWFAKR